MIWKVTCFRRQTLNASGRAPLQTVACPSWCRVRVFRTRCPTTAVRGRQCRSACMIIWWYRGARQTTVDGVTSTAVANSAPSQTRGRRKRFAVSPQSSSSWNPRGVDLISCTGTAQPFRLIYHTNGDETLSYPAGQRDFGAANNVGFCLSFQQDAHWLAEMFLLLRDGYSVNQS